MLCLTITPKTLGLWQGAINRRLMLCTPCPCGCDGKQTSEKFGYLTASNEKGEGFTLWLSESEFRGVSECITPTEDSHES